MRSTTPEDIARAVTRWARRYCNDAPPYMVVYKYLRLGNKWSPDLAVKVRSAIAQIAGNVSAESRRTRKRYRQKRKAAARQLKLDL